MTRRLYLTRVSSPPSETAMPGRPCRLMGGLELTVLLLTSVPCVILHCHLCQRKEGDPKKTTLCLSPENMFLKLMYIPSSASPASSSSGQIPCARGCSTLVITRWYLLTSSSACKTQSGEFGLYVNNLVCNI